MENEAGDLSRKQVMLLTLALSVLVVAAFFLVDVVVGLALLGGGVAAFLVRWLSSHPRINIIGAFLLVIGLGGVITVVILTLLGPQIGSVFSTIVSGASLDEPPICDGLSIRAADMASGTFEVSGMSRSATIHSYDNGLLLKEISFDAEYLLKCRVSDSTPMRIELIDVPRNIFFQARGSEEVSRSRYLNLETITWSQAEAQVTFSYLPQGLRFLRQPLAVFYTASSLGEAVVGVLGFLGTFLISSIIQPSMEDAARDRVVKWVLARFRKKGKGGTASHMKATVQHRAAQRSQSDYNPAETLPHMPAGSKGSESDPDVTRQHIPPGSKQ